MPVQQPAGPPPNYGQTDAARNDNNPLKIVLVRGLKPTTTEELFAKGMDKLNRDFDAMGGGATPGSLKRVLLIRDRKTDQSMGYGFAEYHDVRDAQRVVEKAREKDERDQMTIASTRVSVCFPHLGVFPTDDADGKPEYNDKFKFKLFTDNYNKYYDRRYYASLYDVNVKSPYAEQKLFDGKQTVESKTTSAKKKSAEGTLEAPSKKRKAAAPAAPAILSSWASKQKELRGEEEAAAEAQAVLSQPATGVNAIAPVKSAPAVSEPIPAEQSFVHEGDKIICYLCGNELKNRDIGMRHFQESKTHLENLKDEDKKAKGYERLKVRNISLDATFQAAANNITAEDHRSSSPQRQYRDRAAERRKQQPSEPPQNFGFSLKPKSKPSRSSSPSDNESKKPSYGKGLNMLQKHGWSEGQGLGSGGSGIGAPVETAVYATGVGLGHAQSKKGDAVEEAEKATQGLGGTYQDAVLKGRWERYQKM